MLDMVPEIARSYLSSISRSYLPSDLLLISELQCQREERVAGDSFFVADTDQQALSIWWGEKYGPVPRKIQNCFEGQSDRFYLLCSPDLPWEEDPQRENPDDRNRLFELYLSDLERRNLSYKIISGFGLDRIKKAISATEDHTNSSIS